MPTLDTLYLINLLFVGMELVLEIAGVMVCVLNTRHSSRLWVIAVGFCFLMLAHVWSLGIPFVSRHVPQEYMSWLFAGGSFAHLGARLLILLGLILLVLDFRRLGHLVRAIDRD